MSFCANCGAQIQKDAKYCPGCGNKLAEQTIDPICPNCGKQIQKDAQFCASCGNKTTVEFNNSGFSNRPPERINDTSRPSTLTNQISDDGSDDTDDWDDFEDNLSSRTPRARESGNRTRRQVYDAPRKGPSAVSIVSLVFGIVGVFMLPVLSLAIFAAPVVSWEVTDYLIVIGIAAFSFIALITGQMGLVRANRTGAGGRGLAIAGLVLGSVIILVEIVATVVTNL